MRVRLPRLLRLGLPAVAVLAMALAGCGDPATPGPGAPSASPTTSSTITPPGSTGSDGLTVRYLGDDGRVKTIGVEDFPR
jgi:hypothetical protein